MLAAVLCLALTSHQHANSDNVNVHQAINTLFNVLVQHKHPFFGSLNTNYSCGSNQSTKNFQSQELYSTDSYRLLKIAVEIDFLWGEIISSDLNFQALVRAGIRVFLVRGESSNSGKLAYGHVDYRNTISFEGL